MSRMAEIESRENVARVDNLIENFKELDSHNLGEPAHRNDLLRACVVFLHSTIEELVRNLFVEKLPSLPRNVLDEIPFSIHRSSDRPKGIMLGELLHEYRGVFLENIALDSINSYVKVMNINDTVQLATQLKKVQIDKVPLEPTFPDIDGLMKRRHQIVHQMDRSNALDPDTAPVTDITLSQVETWRHSTVRLIELILKQVATPPRKDTL